MFKLCINTITWVGNGPIAEHLKFCLGNCMTVCKFMLLDIVRALEAIAEFLQWKQNYYTSRDWLFVKFECRWACFGCELYSHTFPLNACWQAPYSENPCCCNADSLQRSAFISLIQQRSLPPYMTFLHTLSGTKISYLGPLYLIRISKT